MHVKHMEHCTTHTSRSTFCNIRMKHLKYSFRTYDETKHTLATCSRPYKKRCVYVWRRSMRSRELARGGLTPLWQLAPSAWSFHDRHRVRMSGVHRRPRAPLSMPPVSCMWAGARCIADWGVPKTTQGGGVEDEERA